MASQIIPPGYSKITFTWTLTGSTRFFQSSVEVQNLLLDGSPTTLLNNVITAFTSPSRPFHVAEMLIGFTLTEAKISMVTLGGILLTAINSTPSAGTKPTVSPCPINTSVIVRKNVFPAGRKYRGRMLIPPFYFGEALVDAAGNITSVAVYQTLFNNAFSALSAPNPIVLLHSDPALTPTPLTGYSVNNRIGTIGKRMRG